MVKQRLLTGRVEKVNIKALFSEGGYEEEVKKGSLRGWWKMLTTNRDKTRRDRGENSITRQAHAR